jgi:hypothetical protein
MATKSNKPARQRGRPPADDPLSVRVLCRLDRETKQALDDYAVRTGVGASGAIRIILRERLRADGYLK